MFAKLFDTDRGQILVKLDTDADDSDIPEIRFYVQPAGLGVCSLAISFKGIDSALVERCFQDITMEIACATVAEMYRIAEPLMTTDADTAPREKSAS